MEQNLTKKKQVNKLLKLKPEIKAKNDNKYKVKAIYNSKIHVKKIIGQILGLYYLVF